jgi:maleylpyruvate isomerase
MKLYTYWRSSSAWRVRILLALKGVPFELVPVNLVPAVSEQRGDAHRARNAMAQIPTLEWNEGGTTRRLSQSMAIATFLEHAYPHPPVLPRDPYLRARAIQLAEVVNSGIQPFQNTGTIAHLLELGVAPEPWCSRFVAKGLAALDAEARREPYDFLVGDAPSVADAFLVPQLYNARRFDVRLDAFDRLLEIEARCVELPEFHAAHPDSQPDKPSD